MFIGQKPLWDELDKLISHMKKGNNVHLLFKAPSGYGKSLMAWTVAREVVHRDSIFYCVPAKDGSVNYDLSKRIIIIDEVHELQQPELVYPDMDLKLNCFFLCSNEAGRLKEPLVNRCIPFIFDKYTKAEIKAIIQDEFQTKEIYVPNSWVEEIYKNSDSNPRITKQICNRLSIIFRESGFPIDLDELKYIISNILRIKDGLTVEDIKYLEFLEKVGYASLPLICAGAGLDEQTVRQIIEPKLVRRGLIRISSKGRTLV